eukprot:TRINITY_DN2046_c1_g1_i1.p3 TRINITY_DN2046_c1_g1~~TRINITY_DN2046_c1_g1_i1.p3  ORF type:complete len:164 (-),score=25.78 TRINITY_DN2046_c1_g1_i1:219-710(-)
MLVSVNCSKFTQNLNRLQKPSILLRVQPRLIQVKAQEKNTELNTAEQEESGNDEELAIEALMRENSGKKSKKQRPKVVSPVVEQVYGSSEPTEAQKNETLVVSLLFGLGAIILAEGIFLAASGFLSQEADEFARNVIYPIFSPTVILLLSGSTAYGLWKSKQQ